MVDVWTAGYEEPGFKGAVGLAAAAAAVPGTGVGASRRGVADGVADLEIAAESAGPGRCVSCRMLAGRGCKLKCQSKGTMLSKELVAYGSGGGAPAGASVMILKSSCYV